jgi:hypothetical protein
MVLKAAIKKPSALLAALTNGPRIIGISRKIKMPANSATPISL